MRVVGWPRCEWALCSEPTGLQEAPQNHHTLGGFAAVSKQWLWEVWCSEQSINIQQGCRGKLRGVLETDGWDSADTGNRVIRR